jgi:transposase
VLGALRLCAAPPRIGVQAAASVRMLLALRLYAIRVGIDSARRIAKLTTSDKAFRWIVGP